MMVTDEITARPLFFNIFNGSIVDVAAFQNTCELLLNLGSHSFVFVADRGFFSEQNMIDIKKKGYHFAICVPHEKATSYQNYITEAIQAFATTPCYSTFYEENIYTCKERVTIGSNEHAFKAYVHVFYNAETGGAQINAYQRRLEEVRNLIFKKQTLTDENMCFAKNNFLVDENNNFILDEHNCPIVNNKVYQKTLNNTGIFLVISDTIKKPDAALKAYIKRKAIEDNFSSLKTRMNIKRLRVSSENALVGKCFIMFLAITIRTLLEKIFLKQKEKDEHSLPHKSLQKIINELRAVKEFYFSDTHNYIVKTISKKQRECFDLFSVKVPVSRYSPNLAVANEITECKKPHGDGLRER